MAWASLPVNYHELRSKPHCLRLTYFTELWELVCTYQNCACRDCLLTSVVFPYPGPSSQEPNTNTKTGRHVAVAPPVGRNRGAFLHLPRPGHPGTGSVHLLQIHNHSESHRSARWSQGQLPASLRCAGFVHSLVYVKSQAFPFQQQSGWLLEDGRLGLLRKQRHLRPRPEPVGDPLSVMKQSCGRPHSPGTNPRFSI